MIWFKKVYILTSDQFALKTLSIHGKWDNMINLDPVQRTNKCFPKFRSTIQDAQSCLFVFQRNQEINFLRPDIKGSWAVYSDQKHTCCLLVLLDRRGRQQAHQVPHRQPQQALQHQIWGLAVWWPSEPRKRRHDLRLQSFSASMTIISNSLLRSPSLSSLSLSSLFLSSLSLHSLLLSSLSSLSSLSLLLSSLS